MAAVQPPPDAVLIVALFSRYEEALQWGRDRVATEWGPTPVVSPAWPHAETAYYSRQMGEPLQKQLLVVERIFDPADLAARKLQSNAWEQELADTGQFDVPRPLNIDPGYLTLHKLVLASTKDRAHRIYLRDGIYAEPCLRFQAGQWQPWPWTYPDYCRPEYHQFFTQARSLLKRMRRNRQRGAEGERQ